MTFLYRHPHSGRLVLFVLLSLLVHLLIAYMGPETQPAKEDEAEKPVYVEISPVEEMRETVDARQSHEDVDTHRLGEADQKVVQEQAPEGYDLEDSAPSMPETVTALIPQEKPPALEAPPSAKTTQPEPQQPTPEPALEPAPAPTPIPRLAEPTPEPMTDLKPLPDLQQLLRSSTHAAADVARETRVKQRPDVARGNVVWLNMKHDLLFSFFARFKKGIYGVWNYPRESVERGEEGTLLLEIIVNRNGSIDDVNLLSGSEYERLNREAIAAVFKAAPYGKLPDSYPEEQLRIRAYFHYQLGSRPQIFGR